MVRRLLLLTLLVLASCAASDGAGPFGDVGSLPLRTSAGAQTDLARVLGGRPAIVALTASWCDACTRERPRLDRLRRESLQAGDFVVVAISLDDVTRPEELTYVDASGAFAERGPRVVPTTLVVDPKGRVAFVGGALGRDALDVLARWRTATRRATAKDGAGPAER
jgi:thiol-disulfide isomerase/thioredoxin